VRLIICAVAPYGEQKKIEDRNNDRTHIACILCTWHSNCMRVPFAVNQGAITQSFFRPQITISDCRADLSWGTEDGRAGPGLVTRGRGSGGRRYAGAREPARVHRAPASSQRKVFTPHLYSHGQTESDRVGEAVGGQTFL